MLLPPGRRARQPRVFPPRAPRRSDGEASRVAARRALPPPCLEGPLAERSTANADPRDRLSFSLRQPQVYYPSDIQKVAHTAPSRRSEHCWQGAQARELWWALLAAESGFLIPRYERLRHRTIQPISAVDAWRRSREGAI